MKKLFIILIVLSLFSGIVYSQHLIRVNNNEAADADYKTLQEANDHAADGDTVYIEGSATLYAGADISRRLTIIGPGYLLSENDSTQANGFGAKFNGNIYFKAGSEGSIIVGCEFVYTGIDISVNNILINRCNISSLGFSNNCENIAILQNYIYRINVYSAIVKNCVISNNIITGEIYINSASGPLQITNNSITGCASYNSINCCNASIANNIVCWQTGKIYTNTGNTVHNNILASDGTNANGNQYNVAMANVFVDFNGTNGYSTDGKWQLKPGSPAIGAGISGVDCGAFGGISPYVLSGLPDLPHIYEASIPGTAYSDKGLSCTIKVKTGK